MAYITQTSMNYAHSQAELDKRLTAQRIVKAAYARSNMLGILPFLTDTLVPGFASPLAQTSGQGLTANTDSRNVLMPPSFNLLAKAVNFGQNGKPQDGLSLLPFSNTYGARNLIDMVGKAYPKPKPPGNPGGFSSQDSCTPLSSTPATVCRPTSSCRSRSSCRRTSRCP
jgi:hypothetical protein